LCEGPTDSTGSPELNQILSEKRAGSEEARMSVVSMRFTVAGRILAGIILLGPNLSGQEIASALGLTSKFNIQAQTACEAEMLGKAGAREVSSGKAYDELTEIARAYGRAIPHIYIFPRSWNMAYIAASSAVDGRGKILVGEQAIELFDTIALRGFLGHEMAHLVSDSAAQGCNDYILRNPKMEADADALAARTIGRRPVKAFLERVLALAEGQNWDAKRRLEVLR
jgi:Zn-dependent protease with chaperone function